MQGDDPGLAVARIALGCGNFGGVGSAPGSARGVPLAEPFGGFGPAGADGLIGAYGVSNFDAPQLAAALAAGAPRAVQNSYSLLARQDEPDLLPLCAERGVAYLAFG